QLQTLTPKGLAKYVTGAIGVGGAISGGISLLPLLAVSSPKIIGELFRTIGATSRTVKPILSNINAIRKAQALKNIGVVNEAGNLQLKEEK
ncbi:MAG: hypothetical protein U1C12_01695, partial [Patescibacteria group bacterium]|nr:hypothetical protein [Patescibacteria group bacterium]